MSIVELGVVIVATGIATAMNMIHCMLLSRRIDNVHERLSLTLNDNNLKDFWEEH